MLFLGTTEPADVIFVKSPDDNFDFENATSASDVPRNSVCLVTSSFKAFLFFAGAFFLQSFTIIWLIICCCQKKSTSSDLFEAEHQLASQKRHIARLEKEALALKGKISQLENVIEYESNRRQTRSRPAAPEPDFQVSSKPQQGL